MQSNLLPSIIWFMSLVLCLERFKCRRFINILTQDYSIVFIISHFTFSLFGTEFDEQCMGKYNFFFQHLYWSIISLRWCVSFCFITKCIVIHIHISPYLFPLVSPSLPSSLSHPSRWSQSTELISLCYAAASHQLSVLHLVVYICPCHSLTLSHLTLPPPHILKSILQQVCIFIPVFPLGSS